MNHVINQRMGKRQQCAGLPKAHLPLQARWADSGSRLVDLFRERYPAFRNQQRGYTGNLTTDPQNCLMSELHEVTSW
jgi:hypothetical protein